MKISQGMDKDPAAGSLVQKLMESAVLLADLIIISFSRMVIRKDNGLFHSFQLFFGNMFRSHGSAQAFQPGSDLVHIHHISYGNAGDKGSLIGNDLDQALQSQLPDSLSYRSPADSQFFSDGTLHQLIAFFISSFQDILPDLLKDFFSQ